MRPWSELHLADSASLALDSLHDGSDSRVSSEGSGVDISSTLAVVGSRLDPRVLRVKIPQGHAGAQRSLHASRDGGVVRLGLGSELGGGGVAARARDVELGDVDVETEVGEAFHGAHDGRGGWVVAGGEVGLEADAVDVVAVGEDVLDQGDCVGVLGAGVLDAVVVVEELDVEVGGDGGLAGVLEGEGYVSLADVSQEC